MHVRHERVRIGRRLLRLVRDFRNPVVGSRVRPRPRLGQVAHCRGGPTPNIIPVLLQALGARRPACLLVARHQDHLLDHLPVALEDNRTGRLLRRAWRSARCRPRRLLPSQRTVDQGLQICLLGLLAILMAVSAVGGRRPIQKIPHVGMHVRHERVRIGRRLLRLVRDIRNPVVGSRVRPRPRLGQVAHCRGGRLLDHVQRAK